MWLQSGSDAPRKHTQSHQKQYTKNRCFQTPDFALASLLENAHGEGRSSYRTHQCVPLFAVWIEIGNLIDTEVMQSVLLRVLLLKEQIKQV